MEWEEFRIEYSGALTSRKASDKMMNPRDVKVRAIFVNRCMVVLTGKKKRKKLVTRPPKERTDNPLLLLQSGD